MNSNDETDKKPSVPQEPQLPVAGATTPVDAAPSKPNAAVTPEVLPNRPALYVGNLLKVLMQLPPIWEVMLTDGKMVSSVTNVYLDEKSKRILIESKRPEPRIIIPARR